MIRGPDDNDDDMEEDWRLLRGEGPPLLVVNVSRDVHEHGDESWYVELKGLPASLVSRCMTHKSAVAMHKQLTAALDTNAALALAKAEIIVLKNQLAKLTANEMTAQLQEKIDKRFESLMCTCGHEGKGHTMAPLVDGTRCSASRCACKGFQQAPLVRENVCTGCGLTNVEADPHKECETYGTSGHHFVEREFYLLDDKAAPSSEGIRRDIARNAPSHAPYAPDPFPPMDPNLNFKTETAPSDLFQELLDNI